MEPSRTEPRSRSGLKCPCPTAGRLGVHLHLLAPTHRRRPPLSNSSSATTAGAQTVHGDLTSAFPGARHARANGASPHTIPIGAETHGLRGFVHLDL